jgi:hypothetical protein
LYLVSCQDGFVSEPEFSKQRLAALEAFLVGASAAQNSEVGNPDRLEELTQDFRLWWSSVQNDLRVAHAWRNTKVPEDADHAHVRAAIERVKTSPFKVEEDPCDYNYHHFQDRTSGPQTCAYCGTMRRRDALRARVKEVLSERRR